MTFLISWFIVLLQFLWQSLEDLVGKGMDLWNMAQLVFCAAMYVLPIAVPLGVLLASLMTFGNLGERLELLAMKAAGIPLYTILKPVAAFVAVIAVALFWYMNVALMPLSVRMWQLMYSSRFSNPDLEIPEGVFYNGIQGYSMYIPQKSPQNGAFLDLMIYDNSEGFNNTRIIRADSGLLVMDKSKTFIQLSLYNGESFQILGSQSILPGSNNNDYNRPVSYLKEHFSSKKVVIPFDANFKVMEDDYLKSQFVGKDLLQLKSYSDSVKLQVDSAGHEFARSIGISLQADLKRPPSETSGKSLPVTATQRAIRPQELLQQTSLAQQIDASVRAEEKLNSLMEQAQSMYSSYKYYADDYYVNAREMHRKVTYPLACIIFFFIGAPLGAIIRKGGIGTPIMIAVLFFIIYYMIDTFGIKKINVGEWPVWLGGWISSFVLLPMGSFLAYKATRDSASLNTDTYVIFFKKLFNRHPSRELTFKEFVLSSPSPKQLLSRLAPLMASIEALSQEEYLQSKGMRIDKIASMNWTIKRCSSDLDQWIQDALDLNDHQLFALLESVPYWRSSLGFLSPRLNSVAWVMCIIAPILLPLYLIWKLRLPQVKNLQQSTLVALRNIEQCLQELAIEK